MPDETPVITPPELTVATVELLVVQVPPVVALLNVIVEPVQTVEGPDIAPPLTVTV